MGGGETLLKVPAAAAAMARASETALTVWRAVTVPAAAVATMTRASETALTAWRAVTVPEADAIARRLHHQARALRSLAAIMEACARRRDCALRGLALLIARSARSLARRLDYHAGKLTAAWSRDAFCRRRNAGPPRLRLLTDTLVVALPPPASGSNLGPEAPVAA